MTRRFYKDKLLLDENMSFRRLFPKLNRKNDVKHVTEDLQKSGIADSEVYELAVSLNRLIITFNYKHFLRFVKKSPQAGIIGISGNLSESQMDTKLVAFLKKQSPQSLYGAFHYISGES